MVTRCANLLGHVVSNVDLLVVQQHPVDGLDGRLGSFRGVIVNVAITLGESSFVCCDLAREDITEGSEGVMESLRQQVRKTKLRKGQLANLLPCCQSVRQGS
jgi:hypothetical protein